MLEDECEAGGASIADFTPWSTARSAARLEPVNNATESRFDQVGEMALIVMLVVRRGYAHSPLGK